MTDTRTAEGRMSPPNARPRLVAHRGAPRLHRENTVEAVLAGARSGAASVEIDLRTTSDGVSVVLHDATLERLWDDPREVADLRWDAVRSLGGGQRIPCLDEVLALAADAGIPLLLDMTSARDAHAGVAAVLAADRLPKLAWCGDPGAMAAVRDALPDADIWLEWVSLRPPTDEDLDRLRPSTVNLDVAFLTPETVADAHARGLAVACWTVDDPALARWAAGLGVDSITTNDVALLASALDDPPDESAESPRDVDARAHALAIRIAEEVVAFTREHPIEKIATKAHAADLVTDVDRLVEQHVRGRVREAFPAHGFTGEEYGASPGDEHRWYLDPVDGTTNLVNGIPWTSVSLCLARGRMPVAGAVADPWRGEVLDARAGHGARIGDRMLRLDPAEERSLVGATVGTELAGHRPWPGLVPFLDALAERSCTLRIMGSGTLTLAQVAAGRGVGACVSAFDPVDHGAAFLLVREAGGVIATPDAEVSEFPERGTPLLVAHPTVARELTHIWRTSLGG